MIDPAVRCAACGQPPHPGAACAPAIDLLADGLGASCRNCLPAPEPEWVACAACGLAQRPGKAFCDFCGSRWRTAEAAPLG
ncbi:MAG: hypothetical protein U0838_17075 [Chloroflexota bacterium]